MQHLPIFLSVRDQRCVVIGGGEIATRKVVQLMRSGATVLVIAPQLCPSLAKFAGEGRLEHVARAYREDGFPTRVPAPDADQQEQ